MVPIHYLLLFQKGNPNCCNRNSRLQRLALLLSSKERAQSRKTEMEDLAKNLRGVVKGEIKQLPNGTGGFSRPHDLTTWYGFGEGIKAKFEHHLSQINNAESKAVEADLAAILKAMGRKEMMIGEEVEFEKMAAWLRKVIAAEPRKVNIGGQGHPKEVDVSTHYGFGEASGEWKKDLERKSRPIAKEFLGALNELEDSLKEVAIAENKIEWAGRKAGDLVREAKKAEYFRLFKELFEGDPDFATAFAMNLSLQQRARDHKLVDASCMFALGGVNFYYSDFGTFDANGRFSLNFGEHFKMQRDMKTMLAEFDEFSRSFSVATPRPPVFVDEVAKEVKALRSENGDLLETKYELERRNLELEKVVRGVQDQLGSTGVLLEQRATEKQTLADEKQGIAAKLRELQAEKERLAAREVALLKDVEKLGAENKKLVDEGKRKDAELSRVKERSGAIQKEAVALYDGAVLAMGKTLTGKALRPVLEVFKTAGQRLGIIAKD